MTYDPRVAIPTLVGSALSCFATSCVLISWLCYGQGKRSFRYALVLNLTFAEWVNSLNNTISGTIAVRNKGVLLAGGACTFNGWIGQMSVQAADFSILAIALVTLLTIKLKAYILNASFDKKILICLSVWAVPLATSTTAVAMKQMKPVSGNWCWISAEKTTLRYALGHGWRFGIIIITICIYIYVFVYMRKRLSYLQETSRTYSYDYGRDLHDLSTRLENQDYKDPSSPQPMLVDEEAPAPGSTPTPPPTKPQSKLLGVNTGLSTASASLPSPLSPLPPSPNPAGPRRRKRRQSKSVEREIWRMLLLNAYPIMYVVLWMPGIVNRIVEATGHQYKWLEIMQCSTQYIGLANALTYGFKEHSRDLAAWFQALR
ncbi:Glucose receptor Git3 [Neofusicoccum parvum]|nr:Glucose receptor Git3 [Neofusicoccum parvum]